MVALKAIVRLLARAVVLTGAATLIVAAALKVQDPGAFRDAIRAHGVIPGFALEPAAYLVIALELLVGVGVLWSAMHKHWRAGALATSAVFACFAIYALALVIRPPAAPSSCGCGFSAGVIEDWTPIAVRNSLIVVALAASALLASTREPQNAETPEASPRASRVVA